MPPLPALPNGSGHFIDNQRKFDVLRAAIVAAAAADAHMFNAVARFVVIDLMQGAVAQTLAGFFAKTMTAGHVAKARHHAACPLATAFAALRIFIIGDVKDAIAGTGWAPGSAAATTDAAAVVGVP